MKRGEVLEFRRLAAIVACLALASCTDDGSTGDDLDADPLMQDAGTDVMDGDVVPDTEGSADASMDDTSETDATTEDGSGMDAMTDTAEEDTGEPDATEPDAMVPDTMEDSTTDAETPSEPWFLGAHPCAGNRTDTLLCTDADTCYVGCGTTTTGRGAFVTTDAGGSWSPVTTTPSGVLANARVNDISLSADGNLYFAGEITSDARVVAMAPGGALSEVWNRRMNIDFSFLAGSFVRTESGLAVAESLTGNGIVYRRADDADAVGSWSSANGFWRDGDDDDVPTGVQILQLVEFDGTIYGSGSVINSPPTVFVSNVTEDEFDFSIIELDATGLGAFNGELWDIDVNADGIVAGGVNQAQGVGVVYTHPNDGSVEVTDPATWSRFDVSTVFPDNATWVQGVCAGEGVLYAVGRESREGWGFVLAMAARPSRTSRSTTE